MQIHPDTDPSYARSPIFFLFKTYQKKVEAWKKRLPHPHFFPLILTRPFDIISYLPAYQILKKEDIRSVLQMAKRENKFNKIVLDFTCAFLASHDLMNTWEKYKDVVISVCKEEGIELGEVICIQRLQEKEVGGIRILLLLPYSISEIKRKGGLLLDWVSTFGLCSNKIELDRAFLCEESWTLGDIRVEFSNVTKQLLLEKIRFFLRKPFSKEKRIIIRGALLPLQGLLEGWEITSISDVKTELIKLSLSNIAQKLEVLEKKGEGISFFDLVSHIEQI